jgi:hypothetical protein
MSELEAEVPLTEAESRLAHQLLDSARADEVTPQATQAAWVKFSGALALTAQQASPAGDVEPALSKLRSVKRAAAASWSRLPWLVLGAVAGSALTAAWLAPDRRPDPSIPLTVTATRVASVAAPVASVPVGVAPVAPPVPAGTIAAREAVLDPLPPRHRDTTRGTPPSSTLAAEVAQLDAARTALAAGAYSEAKRLLAQFHRDFPRGELATEARVIHLELLSAKGDTAALQREGGRFLDLYPRDPHAERVRQLLGLASPP